MFYVIKDNIVYEYSDLVNKAFEYPSEAKELAGVEAAFYETNRDKFMIQDGILVDISNTEEYKAEVESKEKAARREAVLEELASLDLKSIRSIREGGQDENGVPYIDVYQNKINELRAELNSL